MSRAVECRRSQDVRCWYGSPAAVGTRRDRLLVAEARWRVNGKTFIPGRRAWYDLMTIMSVADQPSKVSLGDAGGLISWRGGRRRSGRKPGNSLPSS